MPSNQKISHNRRQRIVPHNRGTSVIDLSHVRSYGYPYLYCNPYDPYCNPYYPEYIYDPFVQSILYDDNDSLEPMTDTGKIQKSHKPQKINVFLIIMILLTFVVIISLVNVHLNNSQCSETDI